MIFEWIKKDLYYIQTERVKSLQPHLIAPSKINPFREKFEKEYVEKGFNYVLKKYCDYGCWNKIKKIPYRVLRKIYRCIKWIILKR